VVIIADRNSQAGMVAKVMDEVRAGGITEVSIAADPGSAG
jgi:biopolymer transport protein ExbD